MNEYGVINDSDSWRFESTYNQKPKTPNGTHVNQGSSNNI